MCRKGKFDHITCVEKFSIKKNEKEKPSKIIPKHVLNFKKTPLKLTQEYVINLKKSPQKLTPKSLINFETLPPKLTQNTYFLKRPHESSPKTQIF